MTEGINIFFSDGNITNLFRKAKDKLQKIYEWFRNFPNFSQAID